MEKQFVTFEIAKKLKELSFDESCLAKYQLDIVGETIPHFRYNYSSEGLWFKHNSKDVSDTNGYKNGIDFLWSAPLWQQAIDWLREEHKIHINIYIGHDENNIWYNLELEPVKLGYDYEPHTCDTDACGTYLETLEKAIKEALKFIK